MRKDLFGITIYYDNTDAYYGKKFVDFNLWDWIKYAFKLRIGRVF